MKDKEKQIEEMAKKIEYAKGSVETWHCRDTNCEKCEYKNCKNSAIAEELIEQGYQKVGKNRVVISQEEYYELKQAKKLLEIKNEEINNLADANIRYSIALENKSKETAEKILKEVAKTCGDYQWFKNLCKQYGVDIKE